MLYLPHTGFSELQAERVKILKLKHQRVVGADTSRVERDVCLHCIMGGTAFTHSGSPGTRTTSAKNNSYRDIWLKWSVCVCVSVFFHWTCLRKNTTFSCLSGRSEKSPVMQAYMSPVQRDYSLNITETAQFFYFLFLPQISIKDPVLSHTHKHTLLPAFWFRQVRFFVLAEPKPSFFTWPKKKPNQICLERKSFSWVFFWRTKNPVWNICH